MGALLLYEVQRPKTFGVKFPQAFFISR